MRPTTGKSIGDTSSKQGGGSIVSSIIGNMYTPSTTARSGTHSVYSRNSFQQSNKEASECSFAQSNKEPSEFSGTLTRRTRRSVHSASSRGSKSQSVRPSTAEVLLAKKQLKLEGMIRKLLVQQQESDSTIAELSEALMRLDPEERDRIDLHDMTAAVRENNRKEGRQLGVQHLNGAPQQGSLRRASPWHLRKNDVSQDISRSLHPETFSGSDTGRSKKHLQLQGKQTKSLLAPASLFDTQKSGLRSSWNVTASPNNNPSNILQHQNPKDKYCAPSIAKHFDSRKISNSLNKWGTDTQTAAWESSPDRWQTHTEDIHGGPTPLVGKLRPQSAMSKKNQQNRKELMSLSYGKRGSSRPATAMSRDKSRPTTAMTGKTKLFGDTDPELVSNPALWTGSGYVNDVYARLGKQNSEKHGRSNHDPELIPACGK